ncbi:hypothetical protein F383_28194 [Gossypium arboreum]|jgi:hypothetical protein
MPLS